MKLFKKNNHCLGCPAICCRYITIELDIPQTIEGFEKIKYYLIHKNTEIIVEQDGTWWIKFITPCEKLNKENKCDIYQIRPLPCKEFSEKTCPFHDKTNKSLIIFKEIEEVNDYIKNVFKKNRHTISK